MLGWAILFLIAAVVAAVLGFGGVASTFAGIAQILFYIFIVIFLAVLILHFVRGGGATPPRI